MQKIYLLLRNNKQSGPHSLDELIGLELKNSDLVWVEGRSMGWSFPTEIESLRPFLPVENSAPPAVPASVEMKSGSVFVSMPAGAQPNERSVHSDRLPDERSKLNNINPPVEDELKNNYSRSLYEVENDYTDWMIRNRKKRNRFAGKKLVVALIIIAGSAGGWWLADMAFSNTRALNANLKNTAPQTINESPGIAGIGTVSMPAEEPVIKPASKQNNRKPTLTKPPMIRINENGNEGAQPIQETQIPVLVKGTQEDNSEKPAENIPAEKKPGLKEKIGNWLKGGKEISLSNSKKEKELVDISDEVEVRIAGEPDSWMMGIKGRKMIVVNKSGNTLNNAIIEVQYFSEENSLMETKKVPVNGLSSGKSKAVAIPDHKLAARVEVKLETAWGE